MLLKQPAYIEDWRFRKKFIFLFLVTFVTLFLLSFSFPHFLFPDAGAYTHHFFETFSGWFAHHVLHVNEPYTREHISDSTGFYVNALTIALMSLIIAGVWLLLDRKRKSYNYLFYFFWSGIRFYVALQLLIYGANKLFKWQFYLPEPNTLYTPLGQLSPDILYWSTMGVSRTYSIITGVLEIMGAVLLLFRRSSLAGAILCFAAFINIFIINVSFDISVKLYTLFLLLLTGIILSPFFKNIYAFLSQKPPASITWVVFSKRQATIKSIVKPLIIILIIVDVMGPYVRSNNYNDDKATRPFLHGAYEIATFTINGDTIPPLLTDTIRWRRVFIHRQGYFIIQKMTDALQDYELTYEKAVNKLWISSAADSVEHPLQYQLLRNDTLLLQGSWDNKEVSMKLKKLDMNNLPAVKQRFHWTIDE